MHQHTGSSLGACSPPALARSRGAWGSNAETHTSCCPPPQHCTGGVARPTRRDSRREVTTLTSLREQAQPSASLVLLCRGGHTAELSPAPALSSDVWGEQETLPPHARTGHESRVHWSHRRGCAGALMSTGSAQRHGQRWLEPAQRSRTCSQLAPNSSWLERGFCWGQASWGPQSRSCGPAPQQGWRAAGHGQGLCQGQH